MLPASGCASVQRVTASRASPYYYVVVVHWQTVTSESNAGVRHLTVTFKSRLLLCVCDDSVLVELEIQRGGHC